MSDRELLELAAKAAGIGHPNHLWADFCGPGIKTLSGIVWNPLADDAAALRLAVKCSVLDPGDNYVVFRAMYVEELNNDLRPSEATRRAIVRAAVEIGRLTT